jgi:hypothetical protein
MKLWLASTDSNTVARRFESGLFAGVLTNPTTLAAAQRPHLDVMRDLCGATAAPVFYQLRDGSVDQMKQQADHLAAQGWHNLGIKVPATPAGFQVLAWLKDQGITLRLATAVPSVLQVLLLTALEVPWITPAGSALEKLGGTPKLDLLGEMQVAIDQQNANCTLIPSINSAAELTALGLRGIKAAFVWDHAVDRLLQSDLVDSTVASFTTAWQSPHAPPSAENY